ARVHLTVQRDRVRLVAAEGRVERLDAVAGDGAVRPGQGLRPRVDRQRLAAARVLRGVVVAEPAVHVPDQQTVLVRVVLHLVAVGEGPAEVVRAGAQRLVVAAVRTVLRDVVVLVRDLVGAVGAHGDEAVGGPGG